MFMLPPSNPQRTISKPINPNKMEKLLLLLTIVSNMCISRGYGERCLSRMFGAQFHDRVPVRLSKARTSLRKGQSFPVVECVA